MNLKGEMKDKEFNDIRKMMEKIDDYSYFVGEGGKYFLLEYIAYLGLKKRIV